MKTLKDFVVFDRLTVHQLVVEPKRVKATYTLRMPEGAEVSTELIYSYDQVFFDKKSYKDVNLASMMAAQVAINYGLFCKEIVFDGIYEGADTRFIRTMMENTSREILTNKLLVDNPFIKEGYKEIIVEKQSKYTAAAIQFVNTGYQHMKAEVFSSVPDYGHFAILSSGGKDSLLTYGIVKELGVAHPVFVNESGRHWFTALNAYRDLKEKDPNTVKPWCNADRLFNWMLKKMPFIKENFQNMRADIYPIRLWTVAVFLFGVLPVVRKRGIGNVLIGNEYDTTDTAITQGIKHYNGLYDQSKYFDQALTRYYKEKNWEIYQYSMLRSLSELLIMKVLVKRYPELQQHQVSCHAAHEHEHRMYPCGKCEKCRRIIGMLVALEEDPKRCGYTDTQIENGLQQLAQKSVKQIGSDAAHLYHLLVEKGAIEKNNFTKKIAKAYPRIMKLRFDSERSRPEEMPLAVRDKVIALFAAYAEGIAVKENKQWIEVPALTTVSKI
ncbi:hypothetical protein [Algivirga pacifica]|uniref:7-cyano-7-deazaguanine synthase (Queuosine biosynthesis) n=1 Tax=Algivirga pacifica TaxID=1162670 RepID=A0ABP9CZF4_9BACT